MKLYSVGIQLDYMPSNGWIATVEYSTWQHADVDCVEGKIGTRYCATDISRVVDRALAAARAIGVEFVKNEAVEPSLYVPGDGQGEGVKLPPLWKEMLKGECDRIGWKCAYA